MVSKLGERDKVFAGVDPTDAANARVTPDKQFEEYLDSQHHIAALVDTKAYFATQQAVALLPTIVEEHLGDWLELELVE